MPEINSLVFPILMIVIVIVTVVIFLNMRKGKPLSREAAYARQTEREDAKHAADAAIWDPLWAVYDARQEERKVALAAEHPEFVIARALGADYPDFIITQRGIYRTNDCVPTRRVYWGGGDKPSYTSAPPPDADVPWSIVYERLTHQTFKSEKLAATWLQRYTDRRAAQVAYDSDGARLGSYTARDADEDADMMTRRWNERD